MYRSGHRTIVFMATQRPLIGANRSPLYKQPPSEAVVEQTGSKLSKNCAVLAGDKPDEYGPPVLSDTPSSGVVQAIMVSSPIAHLR
jgi:hypothetical protein